MSKKRPSKSRKATGAKTTPRGGGITTVIGTTKGPSTRRIDPNFNRAPPEQPR